MAKQLIPRRVRSGQLLVGFTEMGLQRADCFHPDGYAARAHVRRASGPARQCLHQRWSIGQELHRVTVGFRTLTRQIRVAGHELSRARETDPLAACAGRLVPRCVATTFIDRFAGHKASCRRVFPAGFHFHDLRHTGNNLAAASGASTRELMHRMGHGSVRAALIYQHATGERDREIADALQFRIEPELKEMGPIEGPRLGVDGPSLGQEPQKKRGD